MNKKLLTLAIPTYNMEDYIERCIRSCECENMRYLELIIVNDGSTDRSSEISHKLEKEYDGIVRVIDKENGNYGSCVNRALNEAKGKYFKMLDPDDWADTDSLNELLCKMCEVDADLFITVAEDRWLGKDLICRLSIPDSVEEGKIYDARTFDGITMGAKYLYCSHVYTYRTELLRKMGLRLQSGISYTDNEFVFYPLDKIETIVFYNLPLYQYYVGRPGSTTVNSDVKMQTQMWKVLKRMFEYFYNNYDCTVEAVRNNQRIMIIEMVKWIYMPIFRDKHTIRISRDPNTEYFLTAIQPYVNNDEIIKEQVNTFFKSFRPNWYEHYNRTGKLFSYAPLYDWQITKAYMGLIFEKMKHRLYNVYK